MAAWPSPNLFAPGHPNLTPPADDTVIWRYMSFAKYCALLRQAQLFFPAVSSCEDAWEGSQGLWEAAGVELISFFNKVSWLGMTLNDFSKLWNRWVRDWTFISCWHMNDTDSEAMWKLYASAEGSVAIRSTHARLRAVLPNDVGIGIVHYTDYWATPPDPSPFAGYPTPFVFKRKSLAHERELRALIQAVPVTPAGVVDLWKEEKPAGYGVSVNLTQLIETVHVQPNAPEWLVDTVADITARYALHVSVEISKDYVIF
jgi:hypothetical protein